MASKFAQLFVSALVLLTQLLSLAGKIFSLGDYTSKIGTISSFHFMFTCIMLMSLTSMLTDTP